MKAKANNENITGACLLSRPVRRHHVKRVFFFRVKLHVKLYVKLAPQSDTLLLYEASVGQIMRIKTAYVLPINVNLISPNFTLPFRKTANRSLLACFLLALLLFGRSWLACFFLAHTIALLTAC